MSSYHALHRRLLRLEQRMHPPAPNVGRLAASGCFDDEEGALFLAAQPAARQEALWHADHFASADFDRAMQSPALRARIDARIAAWRKARGFPTRAERDLLCGS